jgi:hypothetical protein
MTDLYRGIHPRQVECLIVRRSEDHLFVQACEDFRSEEPGVVSRIQVATKKTC